MRYRCLIGILLISYFYRRERMSKIRLGYMKKGILSGLLIGTFVLGSIPYLKVDAATSNKVVLDQPQKIVVTQVSAKKKNPTDIRLSTIDMIIKVGQKKKLGVTLTPSKNVNDKLKFKSDDKDLISVSSSGVVEGLNEGTCSIIVTTVNGLVALCHVTIISSDSTTTSDASTDNSSSTDIKLTGIYIDRTATVTIGGTYALTTSFTPTNATNKTVTYSLSNDNISITDKGVITGKKYGQTIVTVTTSNGLSSTCVVTVGGTVSSTDPTAIYLSTTELTIGLLSQYTLRPTITPSTAQTTISYYSSNTSVASVNSSGIITGLSKGVAVIYAITSNGKSTQCVVTVTDQTVDVTSIQFAQANVSVNVNSTVQLTTYILPSNATNMALSYYASDPTVASVTNTGVVTGLKVGTTKIYAVTSNGKTCECTVTVNTNQTNVNASYGTVIVNGVQISLGDTGESIITRLGQPTQVDTSSTYGYQLFIYNSSTGKPFMVAVLNNKVIGFIQIP